MLEDLGLGEAAAPEDADVLVFNTCTIREKPDTRLAAHLGDAKMLKERDPERVIAVGGCYAEAQRERIFAQYPFVDVAFGPGSIPHLAEWLGAGGTGVSRSAFGIADERRFAATLPMHRERRFQAWVQVSMGCNSKCAYCIVPAVRGREVSRRPGEIVAEVTRLASEGVREITLLGQNVNSWGRDLRPELDTEFGELLRACDAVEGIERIRFTSPHPKDFRAPVIAAIAECASGLRARAPAAPVGLEPRAEGDAADVQPRALPAACRRAPRRDPGSRVRDGHHRRLPGRERGRLRADARGRRAGRLRQRLHVRLLAARRDRGGGHERPGARRASSTIESSDSSRSFSASRRSATARASASSRRCSSRGRAARTPTRLRGRTRRNTTVNFVGDAQPGELVHVEIDGASSTTLSGRQAALVAA